MLMGQLILDQTVSGATTTVTLDLSSTPIEKGELYELSITTLNGEASVATYSIYANNNQTATNYYAQRLSASATTVAGEITNTSNITASTASGSTSTKAFVRLTNDGYFVTLASHVVTGTQPSVYKRHITSTFNFTNITQLDLVCDVANGIGVDSRIQLYKVARKVDEVEVTGSAVTSVQFSGLSIGKGDEYLVVSDFVSASSYKDVLCYVNNDTTNANYYVQDLQSNNTTVSGNRFNFGYLIGANPPLGVAIAKIKLTNDGYFTMQSSTIYSSASSALTPVLRDWYTTSTFTMSSITQLEFNTNFSANGIGIGSKFELYRLV